MRALWLLPKAAPALLRHIAAYIELAALDVTRAQREFTRAFIATAIAAVCALFALLLACIGVIAYFWDTPYRVVAIAWLAGGFLLLAVIGAVFCMRVMRARSPFLEDIRRQWYADRVILEQLLSDVE